ncbi:mitochondrial ribosome recycling factor 1 [Ptiloglossa arizonensis]|uniref:mitochondrial ribosome recycling factor 1 n=1 Tax=Ptiloglossa arizonensis TaxID=3350558 RepID=UPI003FA02374
MNLQQILKLRILGLNNCLRNLNNCSNLSSINYFSTTHTFLKNKDQCKVQKSKSVNLNELAEVVNTDRMMLEFDKVVDDFKKAMVKHVGVRTSIGAIEELIVKFDGDEYKLQELAEIVRKPKLIVLNLSAFPQTIPSILEMLLKSQMNLNPQQEGTTLYIPLPRITREYRERLSKASKSYFVTCKDNITNIRNKHIKNVKQKKDLSEDVIFRVEGYISTISKNYINEVQILLDIKQKELLGESE